MADLENDLALLRMFVARELETINHYRSLIRDCPDASAREFLSHVVEEEKSHVADALAAIAALDVDQAVFLAAGFRVGHAPGQIPDRGLGDERTESTLETGVAVLSSDVGDASSANDVHSPEGPRRTRERTTVDAVELLTVGSLRGLPQP